MKEFYVTKREIISQPLEERLSRYASYINGLFKGKLITLSQESLSEFRSNYFNDGVPDETGLLPIERKAVGSKTMPVDGIYFLLKKWQARKPTPIVSAPEKKDQQLQPIKPINTDDLYNRPKLAAR